MRKLLLSVAVAALVAGCQTAGQRPAPPKPEIKVERSEAATGGASVKLRFFHHDGDSAPYGRASVTLDTPEKLQAYRQQLAFALDQIEDAEKRMKVHEQSSAPAR